MTARAVAAAGVGGQSRVPPSGGGRSGVAPGTNGSLVQTRLGAAAARLEKARCDTARLDAELLLAHALGVARERLVLDADAIVDGPASECFESLVTRREGREPVAYILGRRDFRRISLLVDQRVLIPRPETELLVEVGLRLPVGSRVVDVGTGSGAVALALADERPDLDVWGTDISPDALAVAKANAARLGLDVTLACADLLEGVSERFDALLANLPYVAECAKLPPEVALFEPRSALLAGRDGLEELRRLATMLAGVPTVALEVGFDQADAVVALLAGAGFASIERLQDLAGHERVIVGRR
ncbi:MAG: peptide chain release factor N(5)-glutamine methyltransferase [Actinomycetota bacterium]|nr:peptide chain release factor N(5)-glutamine methyltransferase [Actinomycetota bacterium]